MNPILQLYALCLDELPNYNKTPTYWSEVEEALKEKPLYKDDTKRKNRIANLKLQMVKELLFDEFIYMLCEPPKSRKPAKKYLPPEPVKRGTPTIISQIPAPAKTAVMTTLSATISVTKKLKTDITLSSAKISLTPRTKPALWTYEYENKNLKNKTGEIIAIILDMVEYVREKPNTKLSIKLKGNKTFIDDYHKSLAAYAEIEKSEMKGDNAIERAIKEGDIGTLRSTQIIVTYMPLINAKEWFVFDK